MGLVAGLLWATAPTTAVDSAAHAYAVPAIARIDTHEFDTVNASPTEFNDPPEESEFRLAEERVAATTPAASFVAIEAAASAGSPGSTLAQNLTKQWR